MDENINIAVSIVMTTYNQDKYIAKAIESVLMQETSFKYELVIGDDCSPDDTQLIIKEYANKYPDKIVAILREKNIGMRNNADHLRRICKGKYMVSLEGDDYWTDPEKLQTEFDFLESHNDYIAVAHWCDVVDENDMITEAYKNKYKVFNFKKDTYTLKDYKNNKIPGHANTIMHRNIYLNPEYDFEKIYKASSIIGDRTSYLILTLMGKVHVIHRIMSHYRYVQKKGQTNYCSRVLDKNQTLDWYDYYVNLEQYIKEVLGIKISLKKLRYEQVISAVAISLKQNNAENKIIRKQIFSKLNKFEMIVNMPIATILKIYRKILWRISA
ncbi:glycosyltransferase [Clostridium sulfidigenes]|uniref:glycosyltransferase n=1 Tax=Clostridium sulfidigenes TaxID=318464 RepID=UPI003F8C9604